MTARDPNPLPAPSELRVDLAEMRRRAEDRRIVAAELPIPWLAQVLADTDASLPKPGNVSLTVALQPGGIVLAQGRLNLRLTVPCGRCLADAAVDGSADLMATFLPAQTAAARASVAGATGEEDEDGLSLHEEDLDTWTYEGTTLQLASLVAEQVKLAYPMRALCERGEACRGLCSNCGATLNALAPDVRTCPDCKAAVPATPVAPEAPADDAPAQTPAEPEKVASLAAALKKAGLTSS